MTFQDLRKRNKLKYSPVTKKSKSKNLIMVPASDISDLNNRIIAKVQRNELERSASREVAARCNIR